MKLLNKIFFITLLLSVFVFSNNSNAQTLTSATSTAAFIFTRNLTIGIRGNDVSVLQQFLITNGFLKILAPTGYFGPLTRTALAAWQASLGIYPPAGFFGPISRARINAINAAAIRIPIAVVATTTVTVVPTSTVFSANPNGSPVRLRIPKLNIDAGFQYTGLKTDGSMEIPTNITDIGWFTGSVRPGERGTSVITGHVAQIRGGVLTKQGVFFNLSDLTPGDILYVVNDRGETITFRVRESRLYDPVADATDVFSSTDGGIHLNIITCEGTWNPAELSYSQRLVVFTDAV